MRMTPLENRTCGRDRQGTTAVEMAIILPLVMLIGIGLCVTELAVFRYHQVAHLAHEGARWASVHGPGYSQFAKQPVATTQDIIDNVVKPRATGLDLSKLTTELEWDEDHTSVKVTIRYQWTPEAFFAPGTFTCTSVALTSY